MAIGFDNIDPQFPLEPGAEAPEYFPTDPGAAAYLTPQGPKEGTGEGAAPHNWFLDYLKEVMRGMSPSSQAAARTTAGSNLHKVDTRPGNAAGQAAATKGLVGMIGGAGAGASAF